MNQSTPSRATSFYIKDITSASTTTKIRGLHPHRQNWKPIAAWTQRISQRRRRLSWGDIGGGMMLINRWLDNICKKVAKRFCSIEKCFYICSVRTRQASQRCSNVLRVVFFLYIRYERETAIHKYHFSSKQYDRQVENTPHCLPLNRHHRNRLSARLG